MTTKESTKGPTPPAEPTEAEAAKVAAENAAKAAAEKAASEAKQAAAAKEKADEQRRKEEAKRTVTVRATRRGQYPATGKIRNPGDEFDYVLHRRPDGTLEEKLPTWMVDVAGKVETLGADEPSTPPPEKVTIEVSGSGANTTATVKSSRSVI